MSVLLDTNVVSELIRRARDPDVTDWMVGLRLEDLYFSAIGEAVLRCGAAAAIAFSFMIETLFLGEWPWWAWGIAGL